VNKIKPLIELNPYFKLRPTFNCSTLNKSVSHNLYGLIKHFSQRETLINNMKRFSHNLLMPIAISSLLVGNVTAQSNNTFGALFSLNQVHSEAQSPNQVHSEAQTPNQVHSEAQSPYQVHSEAQSPNQVHSEAQSPYQVHSEAQSPNQVHSEAQDVPSSPHSVSSADVSFDTVPDSRKGPHAVDLGRAGSFSILSKSGITDVYRSAIVGDVGTSPITGAALLLTCEEVKGTIFTVDAAGPYPCAKSKASYLTKSVGDMEAAYVNAAGRSSPDFIELGAGEIGGLTLEPGLYKWSSGVTISTDVTFSGGPNDVWILQIAGTMNEAVSTKVTLAGGALARNIFWQVAEATTIGSYAHFEGVILSKTMIAVNTGASVNGRLLAQTAVTLQMNTITEPSK
jgi:hypothetical protein